MMLIFPNLKGKYQHVIKKNEIIKSKLSLLFIKHVTMSLQELIDNKVSVKTIKRTINQHPFDYLTGNKKIDQLIHKSYEKRWINGDFIKLPDIINKKKILINLINNDRFKYLHRFIDENDIINCIKSYKLSDSIIEKLITRIKRISMIGYIIKETGKKCIYNVTHLLSKMTFEDFASCGFVNVILSSIYYNYKELIQLIGDNYHRKIYCDEENNLNIIQLTVARGMSDLFCGFMKIHDIDAEWLRDQKLDKHILSLDRETPGYIFAAESIVECIRDKGFFIDFDDDSIEIIYSKLLTPKIVRKKSFAEKLETRYNHINIFSGETVKKIISCVGNNCTFIPPAITKLSPYQYYLSGRCFDDIVPFSDYLLAANVLIKENIFYVSVKKMRVFRFFKIISQLHFDVLEVLMQNYHGNYRHRVNAKITIHCMKILLSPQLN